MASSVQHLLCHTFYFILFYFIFTFWSDLDMFIRLLVLINEPDFRASCVCPGGSVG